MSDDIGAIRVEGARELSRALRAASDELADLTDANREASRVLLAGADLRVPRLTGALAASGRIDPSRSQANVVYGNARVAYAPAVHWGVASRHMRAQPWVTDAAAATEPEWVRAYATAVEHVVDKIERST